MLTPPSKRDSVYLVAKHLVARRSSVGGEWSLSVLRDPRMADDLGQRDAELWVGFDELVQ